MLWTNTLGGIKSPRMTGQWLTEHEQRRNRSRDATWGLTCSKADPETKSTLQVAFREKHFALLSWFHMFKGSMRQGDGNDVTILQFWKGRCLPSTGSVTAFWLVDATELFVPGRIGLQQITPATCIDILKILLPGHWHLLFGMRQLDHSCLLTANYFMWENAMLHCQVLQAMLMY